MNNATSVRVYTLEFWRFVYALVIMVYHSYEFGLASYPFVYSGGLFVEFYFIVSGYFATAYARKNSENEQISGGGWTMYLRK